VAQVRYFRTADEDKAKKALGVLKGRYPNAKLVAFNLPAPAGQLEVWLPKAHLSSEPVCTFVSIKALGWNSGHKTNFCKANGYPDGNFNPGEKYSEGGICMVGPEPDVCKAQAQGIIDKSTRCTLEGNRTVCYRQTE
jgi:hypothetical protein